MNGFLRGRLSSGRHRVTLVVTAVVLAAGAGIGGAAAAATLAAGTSTASGPPQSVVAPDGLAPGGNGQAKAAAMAVPQASHTGAGWADHPLWVKKQNSPTAASPQLTSTAPRGYSPALVRSYLRLTGTGKGQTVAVVDAYDNPYAAADLTTFSQQFGLPLPCAKGGARSGCFSFSSVSPYGTASADPGWALESDLDVQMVHTVAPDASIVLVQAHDNSLVALTESIDYAAGLGVSVISNSWGAAEFSAETAGDGHCALKSALCVFSSGDSGNPGGYPAYDPHVLAVGGTTLALTPSGAVDFEAAWCCNTGATGGGVSAYEPRPSYQDGVGPYDHRGMPDVSFDADPLTGVPVYDSFGLPDGSGSLQSGWFQVGGTSAGAPAWAGIAAAADQLRAKAKRAPLAGAGFQAQQLIYSMPHTAFRDITVGVDNVTACSTPIEICRAAAGYDTVTGWGSPAPGIDTALAQAG